MDVKSLEASAPLAADDKPEAVSAKTDKGAEAPAAMPAAGALAPEEYDRLKDDIVAALKTVYDPEIPADIYELGLIYDIGIDGDRNVAITMTLTAPACPVAGEMPQWVRERRQCGAGCRPHDRHHDVRSAVGHEPHVGRGAARAQYVLIPGCAGFAGRADVPYIDETKTFG